MHIWPCLFANLFLRRAIFVFSATPTATPHTRCGGYV
jgi:hypothetical protein